MGLHGLPATLLVLIYPLPWLSPSLYAMGMLILGVSLAGLGGGTGLNDPGVVQILYLVLLPAAMYALCMIAKFWVEGLPSQVRRGNGNSFLRCRFTVSGWEPHERLVVPESVAFGSARLASDDTSHFKNILQKNNEQAVSPRHINVKGYPRYPGQECAAGQLAQLENVVFRFVCSSSRGNHMHFTTFSVLSEDSSSVAFLGLA